MDDDPYQRKTHKKRRRFFAYKKGGPRRTVPRG